MHNVYDFIKWALTKAHRKTLIKSAKYPIPTEQIGTDEWEYLFGSVRVQTNQDTLDRYYNDHYCHSMTREAYDAITASWSRTGYATDCQGLLDAWLTYETGVPTDINVNMNYNYWCTDKGEIGKISRPYVIGEAVFMYSSNQGKMTHIGWVCGFTDGGEALVVEARAIKHGVVVTKIGDRNWTHRGLMTAQFDYSEPEPTPDPVTEPIRLEHTRPNMEGAHVLAIQKALNALHYTDAGGNMLEEDGKCGRCTMEAVRAFADAHASIREPETVPIEVPVLPPVVGRLDFKADGLTICVFRTADLPKEESNV